MKFIVDGTAESFLDLINCLKMHNFLFPAADIKKFRATLLTIILFQ